MNSLKITKVALFDFCGTFVNFQTGDEFIRYSVRNFYGDDERIKNAINKINAYRKFGITFFHDFFGRTPLSKSVLASVTKGIPYIRLDELAKQYSSDMLFPNIVQPTIELFNECKKNGYYIVLVSAAYDIYLKHFSNKYSFDVILSSSLGVNNNCLTGKILNDTVGTKKVKRTLKWLDKEIGKGSYEIVLSVGDSKKDIPILNLAKRKIVISKKHHQSWVDESFEEIIYGN